MEIFNTVLDVCAEVNQVGQEQILGRSRKRRIQYARHMTAFFTKKYTELTLASIGEKLSGRDHATVINSLKKFGYHYERIVYFRDKADEIEQLLMQRLQELVGNKRLEYEFLDK